jgi:hypothetical protein
VREDRLVEPPRPQRRTRKRASSVRADVHNVVVTPGEFVLARYYSVYGLNGRTP